MAGSAVTQKVYDVEPVGNGLGFSIIELGWTSDDATGAVEAATNAAVTKIVTGKWLLQAQTKPTSGGTAPTDNYDIVLNDDLSMDVMGGTLANRSSTLTQVALPYPGSLTYAPVPVKGALTLSITNAGNAKKGTVYLYLSR